MTSYTRENSFMKLNQSTLWNPNSHGHVDWEKI